MLNPFLRVNFHVTATLLVAVLVLVGCATPPAAPSTTVDTTPAATTTPQAETEPSEDAPAVSARVTADEAPATSPIFLSIAEIDMNVAVSPMTWRVIETDGVRTTAWLLPQSGAGWHPNSAGAGGEGNVVISGHQLLGDAPFAPIALGDIAPEQEIVLTDAEGNSFTYVVTEVTDPLPIPDSLSEEQDLAAEYAAPTAVPSLTLISGWPDFSTTHRVIVRAELVSDAP
ncbi:sortase [bacterium]|nr:sortase [bacterium]